MKEPAATQERSISIQLDNAKAKKRHVKVHEDAAIYDKKTHMAVRGIVYSILFSIPIWLIIVMLVVWSV